MRVEWLDDAMTEAVVTHWRRRANVVRRFSMMLGIDSEWRFASTDRCIGYILSARIEWRRSREIRRQVRERARGLEWERVERLPRAELRVLKGGR